MPGARVPEVTSTPTSPLPPPHSTGTTGSRLTLQVTTTQRPGKPPKAAFFLSNNKKEGVGGGGLFFPPASLSLAPAGGALGTGGRCCSAEEPGPGQPRGRAARPRCLEGGPEGRRLWGGGPASLPPTPQKKINNQPQPDEVPEARRGPGVEASRWRSLEPCRFWGNGEMGPLGSSGS